MACCFKRGLAGKRNRRRRQAAARVGIVRRIALQVGLADSAFIRIAHTIDDGRVSLQAHTDIQAVDEYSGHMGAVVFVRGFFFNQTRHNQHFVRIFIRQAALTVIPCFLQVFPHLTVGDFVNLKIAAAGINFVTIREKLSFGIAAQGIGCHFGHQFFITPTARIVGNVGSVIDNTAHLCKTRAFQNLHADRVRAAFFNAF